MSHCKKIEGDDIKKYLNIFGPPNGMSAASNEFNEYYLSACTKIYEAIEEFENKTDRVVKDISLDMLDASSYTGVAYLRQSSISFLPIPSGLS